MESSLVFLGYVVDGRKVIGAKLSDVVKGESSLINIDSFKNGVKNGIKVINVQYDRELKFTGGVSAYSLYDKKGNIKRLGSKVLVESDNGEWLVAKQDGNVYKTADITGSKSETGIIKIPNQNRLREEKVGKLKIDKDTNKQESNMNLTKYSGLNDFDLFELLFKERNTIDYVRELGKHIEAVSIRGTTADIITGQYRFILEKSNFVMYQGSKLHESWNKVKQVAKFKIKTILASTLNLGGISNEIVLMSSELYKGSKDFYFTGIQVNHCYYTINFRLRDIIYIRDVSNWYGNKEILNGVNIVVPKEFKGSNVEMIIGGKGIASATIIVISSHKLMMNNREYFEYNLSYMNLDKNYNFDKDANILSTVVSHLVTSNNITGIPRNDILDLLSKFDSIRRINKPNIGNIMEYMPIEAADKSNKALYREEYFNTKDDVNIYSANEKLLMVLYTGLRNYDMVNLYKNEIAECNLLLNRKYANEFGIDKDRLYMVRDMIYTNLTKDEFDKMAASLHKNKVYTNMPVSYDTYVHNSVIVETISYGVITDGESIQVNTDRKHNLVLLNMKDVLNRHGKENIVKKYSGMDELSSVVYLIYRAVLKYDKSIPRCNEQLMFDGSIEDILDRLVISENIDIKNDKVSVYIDRYKIEMKLSKAKEKLVQIYNRFTNMNDGESSMKLKLMKMAAGIDTLNGNLVLNELVVNRSIVVPDIIKGLYVETERELELNKLTLTKNVDINFKTYGTLKVKNLELKNKANNMIQRYSKSNNKLLYEKCKIHDIDISGRNLYNLLLTMLFINDTFIKNRYIKNPCMEPVGSREYEIARYVYVNLDKPVNSHLENLIKNIHSIYDIRLSDKSILSLVKYVETLTDIKKFQALTNCDNPDFVGKYMILLGLVLRSYDVNEYCCNGIIKVGKNIQEQVIKIRI